jgi:hypothetical protein
MCKHSFIDTILLENIQIDIVEAVRDKFSQNGIWCDYSEVKSSSEMEFPIVCFNEHSFGKFSKKLPDEVYGTCKIFKTKDGFKHELLNIPSSIKKLKLHNVVSEALKRACSPKYYRNCIRI